MLRQTNVMGNAWWNKVLLLMVAEKKREEGEVRVPISSSRACPQ
jgi:hypothetical protein